MQLEDKAVDQCIDEILTMTRFIDQWIADLDDAPRALAAMNAAEDEIHAQEAHNVSFE